MSIGIDLGLAMKRREFIGLIGGAALSFPRSGYAQSKTDLPTVGFLSVLKETAGFTRPRVDALRKGLQEEGLIEGKNYSLAMRFLEGDANRIPQLAAELTGLKPQVIVVAPLGIAAVRRLSPDLPVVFTAVAADPVALGLVESYQRPGGMITGNVMNAVGGEETVTQKRIGFLKEMLPRLTRLGMIGSEPSNPSAGPLVIKERDALQKVAPQFGFEFTHYGLKTLDDLEAAFATGIRDDMSAFYISGEPMLIANMPRVMASVTSSGKPTVGPYPDWGRAGLLMSYATDPVDGYRQAGVYAAKILKGAKPSDLPVEQASKFTLVINQKTAKTLGIVVPPTLLALADEVIE